MTRITFVDHAGAEYVVSANANQSLMEAAVQNAVPGIIAECGGACACATCHVYVSQTHQQHAGNSSEMEQSMLDFAEGVTSESRLACQILVSPAMEGMVVRIPESQA